MNAIEWMLEIPQRNAAREFLIDTISGEVLTFGELYQKSISIAADLRKRGLQRGDRIALLLHNSVDFVKLYFGCLYAGVITVPINPVFIHQEIEFMIRHSGAKILVVSPETINQININAFYNLGIHILALLDKRILRNTLTKVEIWDFENLRKDTGFLPFEGASPDDTMTIVYTSGTTAHPMGVVHRISDMIDNARLFNQHMGIGPQNRFYGVLAMTYLGGYYNLLMLPYVGESSVVLCHAFDARLAINFWNPARENRVNTLWLVPTILSILMKTDRGRDGERFCREQLKLALVGTAPLSLRQRFEFEKRYGITLYENYGLSETFFISTNVPFTPIVDGSVGAVLPGVNVEIRNTEGNAQPNENEGEIFVRTPYLMKGYYDPKSGQPIHISKDDWFATGDMGKLAKTGHLFITGRRKDMIIRGGINISPATVEEVLYKHPAIIECAVVGTPHTIYGEVIAAVVKVGSEYNWATVKADLVNLCKENLGAIKQPSYIFKIMDFPKSSSGKIQKVQVREWIEHEISKDSEVQQ